MARLLGISQQTYSKYESGLIVPPFPTQARIAAMLATSVETLWPTKEESVAS
jgi:DNA-binding XRE family transcriptional regulator